MYRSRTNHYSNNPAAKPTAESITEATPPTARRPDPDFAAVVDDAAEAAADELEATIDAAGTPADALPEAEADAVPPVALAEKASKVLGLLAFTFTAKTIPCVQCPVCAQ